MLNAELVENFHSVFRQKKSGALSVTSDAANIRFLFQDGEVMAMDLGEDKEHLLADKLMEYHRLDGAQHALVFATREKVQGTVAEIVRNLHLCTESEVAQSTRSMVEDALCNLFSSSVRHIQFQGGQGAETFNFERSAVRLRIGVEVLLKTVDQRVSEIQEVQKTVPSWDTVFAFAEGGEDAGALSDFEKHVLNFVDGQRSVEEIATACRDASLSLARTLHGLSKKGVVRKQAAATRAPKQTSGPQRDPSAGSGAQQIAAPKSARQSGEMRLGAKSSGELRLAAKASGEHRLSARAETVDAPPAEAAPEEAPAPAAPAKPAGPPPNPRRRAMMVSMAVLAVGYGAYWGYNKYQLSADFAQTQESIESLCHNGNWNGAIKAIDAIREEYNAHQPSLLPRLDELSDTVSAMLHTEVLNIHALLESGQLDQASLRIEQLPEIDDREELRETLSKTREKVAAEAEKAEHDVDNFLNTGDVAGLSAFLASKKSNAAIFAAAVSERDLWRNHQIMEAGSSAATLAERVRLIGIVRSVSSPEAPLSSEQAGNVAKIEAEIKRIQSTLVAQVARLQAIAEKGDYESALIQSANLGISGATRGNPELALKYREFQTVCEQMRARFLSMRTVAEQAVSMGAPPERLSELASADRAMLVKYPDESRFSDDDAYVNALQEIADCLALPIDQQAIALQQIMDPEKMDSAMLAALKKRVANSTANQSEADAMLDSARQHAKDADYAQAEHVYEAIIARKEWDATPQHKAAVEELAQCKSAQAKFQSGKTNLALEIAQGHFDRATQIARDIGLRYLPLVIDSQPGAAQVYQGDKLLGKTPLVLEIPAADRVDFAIQLRQDGYIAKDLVGANAGGGWHLYAALERIAAVNADIGQTVTSHPVVIGGKVWVSNRFGAFSIGPDGGIESTVYQGVAGAMPLNEPVYARITESPNGMYVPTREKVAILLGKSSEREPLGAPTDFSIGVFESPDVIDSRFLLCCGNDTALHGLVEARPSQHWDSTTGAPFVCGPVVVGEDAFTVRADGTLTSTRAYDGQVVSHGQLGGKVISAWRIDGGLAGYTSDEYWTWDGKEIAVAPLPEACQIGTYGAVVGINGRSWVRNGSKWSEVGRVDGVPTGDPVAWGGTAVVPVGQTMVILGPGGYATTASADFLPPVVLKDRLLLISQDGKVRIYTP